MFAKVLQRGGGGRNKDTNKSGRGLGNAHIYAHMSGYIGIVLPSSLHAQLGHCLREGGIPE